MTCRAAVVAALLLCGSVPAAAQQNDGGDAPPFFTWRDAALFAAFAGGTVAAFPVDRSVADRLQDPRTQENRVLSTGSTIFRILGTPGAQIIGLGVYGVGKLTDDEKVTKLGLHGLEALVVGTAITSLIKFSAGRARPFRNPEKPTDFKLFRGLTSGEYQSFPSGHTTTAFAAAAAVTAETAHSWPEAKWIVGPVLFTGAALVGGSRMYNNKHWTTDVLAGAAIGTFAGIKTVRYNYRHPDNRLERTFLSVVATVPSGGGSVSLSLAPMLVRMR